MRWRTRRSPQRSPCFGRGEEPALSIAIERDHGGMVLSNKHIGGSSMYSLALVGLPGFEPGTSASRTQRAAKLRHSPWVDQVIESRVHPTKGT